MPMLVLVVAPRPKDVHPSLSLRHVEAIYTAVESQGEEVRSEWLWPPNAAALSRRLADEPAVPDVVYVDTLAQSAERGADLLTADAAGMAEALEFGALLDTLARRGTLLLLARLLPEGGGDPGGASALAGVVHDSHPAVALLEPSLSASALEAVAAELLAALAGGRTVADALSAANGLVTSGSPLPLQLVGGRATAALSGAASDVASGAEKIIQFPSRELYPLWQRLATFPEPGALPLEPVAGFVGRGAELQQLEAALRDDDIRDPVWVYGYAGVGKTALVSHLARWLVRTGRFENVVYVDWVGGGYPEQALAAIGTRLLGEGFVLGGDSIAAITQALAERPTLLIWDNMEQILPKGASPMAAEPLAELAGLAGNLCRSGASRLVILSDTPQLPSREDRGLRDVWAVNVPTLCADDTAALLAARVGETKGTPSAALLDRLMRTIGGHPLAVGVLSVLAQDSSLEAVLDAMQEAIPGLASGEALLRNQAQELVIERLMQALSGETRRGLHGMALYVGGFMQALAVKNLGLQDEWETIAPRLESTGLVSLRELPGFSVPYVQYHPAFSAYVARRLTARLRADSEQGVAQSYLGLLHWVLTLDARMAAMGLLLAQRELPNFRNSLTALLRSDDLNTAIGYARYYMQLLDALHLSAEKAAVAKVVEQTAAAAMPAEGPLARPGVQLVLGQIARMSSSGRLTDAGAILQQLCTRMSAEDGLSYSGEAAEQDRGVAFAQLGHFMRVAGRPQEAMAAYGQALTHLGQAGTSDDVKRHLVSLFEGIGQTMAAVGQWQGAEEASQKGLDAATQLGDPSLMGNMTVQLAGASAAGGKPDLAKERFASALALFESIGDNVRMSSCWGQLAGLAQAQDDLDEAQRCLREALRYAEDAGNLGLQAQLQMQLGAVSARTGALDEAEMRLERAITISDQGQMRPALAAAQRSLAGLLLERERYQDARIQAEAARATAEPLGPAARPWETHLLLMRIAEAEGNARDRARWIRAAQEAFWKSREAGAIRTQWATLITAVATSCRGEAIGVEAVDAVEKLEATEQWQSLAGAIWRVLGGERGVSALDDLDLVDAVVVRAILEAIDAPEPTPEDDA